VAGEPEANNNSLLHNSPVVENMLSSGTDDDGEISEVQPVGI